MTKTQQGQQQDEKAKKVAEYLYKWKGTDLELNACAIAAQYMSGEGGVDSQKPDRMMNPMDLQKSMGGAGKKYAQELQKPEVKEIQQALEKSSSPKNLWESIKKIFTSKEKWQQQSVDRMVEAMKARSSNKAVPTPPSKPSANKGLEVG